MNIHVLIADDQPEEVKELETYLHEKDVEVTVVQDGATALEMILDGLVDCLVTETVLPELGGKELIQKVLAEFPTFPILVRTGFINMDDAFHFARIGVVSYNLKSDSEPEKYADYVIASATGEVQRELNDTPVPAAQPFTHFISRNDRMSTIFRTAIDRVAKAPSTVLITGESGTGKELLASTIHRHSNRKDNPWVAVNCASLPETLIESELFGHEKGSFTGAISRRTGRFEQADTGTFFLDEIGDLSMVIQTKLLRVLQEKTIERVGSNKLVKIDVRIIAATHRNLKEMVNDGSFREDLYYRLSVINLKLPPLRERPEDITGLAQFFLERFRKQIGRDEIVLTPRVLMALRSYNWKGNVRELENVIEGAAVMAPHDQIELTDLPKEIRN
ncbi:MAG: sigma-54 dependent transcriptional regulator, partial [Candidatus Electryonea clarkiae]|nr:sigma-54 dependent transcriptional regulator [Candidatus Electryonea clarkiae]